MDRIKFAGYSSEELLGTYRSDLFDYYLPYLDRNIYDEMNGGFMCHTKRNGKQVTTHKRTWYDGRGIWVYSYLYRLFGQQEKHLRRAKQTIDFLEKMESDDYPFWPWEYTRDGKPLDGENADIYGALFVAEGMAEYAAAAGQDEYWLKAKDILLKCVDEYDKKSYEYIPHYTTSSASQKAPRVLGHWMILLNLSRQLLDQRDDQDVRSICDRSIEAIMDHHLHPEFNLLVEYLNHDFSLPDPPMDQFVYTGHGMETLWMIMKEAIRRRENALYDKTADLFRRHVEVSWDRVYGGFFHELTHVDENRWLMDKVLWAQEEVLTGLMMMIAKNQDPWAVRWFNQVYPYVREHFMIHDHPNKLWINGGDRRMENHHQVDRFENYHHPRHLTMNIRTLEWFLHS